MIVSLFYSPVISNFPILRDLSLPSSTGIKEEATSKKCLSLRLLLAYTFLPLHLIIIIMDLGRFLMVALNLDDQNDQGTREQCDQSMRQHLSVRVAELERQQRLKDAQEATEGATPSDLLVEILQHEGGTAWDELRPDTVEWNQQVVLAVLNCEKTRPHRLTECVWRTVPATIRNDREILLTRLSRIDFAKGYKWYSYDNTLEPFRIPRDFLGDEEVVAAAVRAYLEVLWKYKNGTFPVPEIMNSEIIFMAFVESQRMLEEHTYYHVGVGRERFERLIGLFSLELRSKAELMLAAAKHMKTEAVFQYFEGDLSSDCTCATALVNAAHNVDQRALDRFFQTSHG